MNDDMQKQIKKHFRQTYQLDSFLRTPDDALEDTFLNLRRPLFIIVLLEIPISYIFSCNRAGTLWTVWHGVCFDATTPINSHRKLPAGRPAGS